jgi:hypothetical protein
VSALSICASDNLRETVIPYGPRHMIQGDHSCDGVPDGPPSHVKINTARFQRHRARMTAGNDKAFLKICTCIFF